KFMCAGLADHDHVLPARDVVLVNGASGQNGDAPGPKISGRNFVRRAGRAFVDRRDIALGSSVEDTTAAVKRNVAANRGALKTGNGLQGIQGILDETSARVLIRILGLRQGDKADPKIRRAESDVLFAQS